MNHFIGYHNEVFRIHKKITSLTDKLDNWRQKLKRDSRTVKTLGEQLSIALTDKLGRATNRGLESDADEDWNPRRRNQKKKQKRGKAGDADKVIKRLSTLVQRISHLNAESNKINDQIGNWFVYAKKLKSEYDEKRQKLIQSGEANSQNLPRVQKIAEKLGYFPISKVYGREDAKLDLRERVALSVFSLREMSFEKDNMEEDVVEIAAKADDLTAVISVIGLSENDPIQTDYDLDKRTFEAERSKFVNNFIQAANYWIRSNEITPEVNMSDDSLNLI